MVLYCIVYFLVQCSIYDTSARKHDEFKADALSIIYPIHFDDGPRPLTLPNEKHKHMNTFLISLRQIILLESKSMCVCFLLGGGLGPSLK